MTLSFNIIETLYYIQFYTKCNTLVSFLRFFGYLGTPLDNRCTKYIEIKHRCSQIQLEAMVSDAEMLGRVPGEGAWQGHLGFARYTLPLLTAAAKQKLKAIFVFHLFQ